MPWVFKELKVFKVDIKGIRVIKGTSRVPKELKARKAIKGIEAMLMALKERRAIKGTLATRTVRKERKAIKDIKGYVGDTAHKAIPVTPE